MTALQAALADITASVRESRREYARNMPADALIAWLTTDSFCKPVQRAARWVMAEPRSTAPTYLLMHRIMRQLRRRFRGEIQSARLANTAAHHNAFRAVARLHMGQRNEELICGDRGALAC